MLGVIEVDNVDVIGQKDGVMKRQNSVLESSTQPGRWGLEIIYLGHCMCGADWHRFDDSAFFRARHTRFEEGAAVLRLLLCARNATKKPRWALALKPL